MRFDHEKYQQNKFVVPFPSDTDTEEQFLARKNAHDQNQQQVSLILSIVLSICICIFLHAFVFSSLFDEDEIEKENHLLMTKGIYQRRRNVNNKQQQQQKSCKANASTSLLERLNRMSETESGEGRTRCRDSMRLFLLL